MIESVKNLRRQITDANSPVLYKWWFKHDGKLFDIFVEHNVDKEKLEKKVIDGVDYYALYVGIGRSCISRFRWHIIPSVHHTPSAAEAGTISTLRQTLCALMGIKMVKGEQYVNNYIDSNCVIEWNTLSPNISREELKSEEKKTIQGGYYPLNIQENTSLPKEWLDYLRKIRSQYR